MSARPLLYELGAALYRQQWPARRLAGYQLNRLRAVVRHSYENVPYYRELFDKSGIRPEDIRSPIHLNLLPLTTKADLQGLPAEALLARGSNPGALKEERTSGSTGRPFTVRSSPGDLVRKRAVYMRALLNIGLRPTDRQVFLTVESGPHNNFRWLQALGLGRRTNEPVSKGLNSHLDHLERMRPDFLLGYPSALRQVALAIRDRGKPDVRPRLICTLAEVLDLDTLRILNSVFRSSVIDLYSATEFGNIAWQCPRTGLKHVNADWLIIEVVRRDGSPAGPDELGMVVCTALGLQAMPFIRFALGDLAAAVDTPCECGCAFPSLGTIEGRTVDQIVRPDGTVLSPYEFTCSLERIPGIGQYQVTQESREHLRILLVPGRGFERAALHEAQARCRAIMGEKASVSVRIVDAIPREPSGKFRVVRSSIMPAEVTES